MPSLARSDIEWSNVRSAPCTRKAPGVASRNDLDLGAKRLRREAAVPPDAERALRAVERHDPAQDREAVLAGPHDPGSQELGRMLRLGEGHDRLVAVLLELAVTERGHRSGRLGLRHSRSATTPCPIRAPHALRDQVDRLLHVLEALRARADDLPAAEQEDRGLRFLDPVDEAGELLRLVFGAAQGEGDRLEVELVPEGSRCDDVLDPELGHGNTSGPGSGIPASLEATARNRSLIYFRPPRNTTRKTERTVARDGRAGHPRLEAGELRIDTLRLRARGGEDVGIGQVTACPRLLNRRRNLLAPGVFFANCRLISWGGAPLFSTRLLHKGTCRCCTF